MVTNRDRVASYLNKDELRALDKFCKEKNCTRSLGIVQLVQEKLVQGKGKELEVTYSSEIENRLHELNSKVIGASILRGEMCSTIDKQGELIAKLQQEIERLKTEIKDSAIYNLSDTQIASITKRRPQEVYDWRMGIRKPRGKNILAALEPFEIVDGMWKKKSK